MVVSWPIIRMFRGGDRNNHYLDILMILRGNGIVTIPKNFGSLVSLRKMKNRYGIFRSRLTLKIQILMFPVFGALKRGL